jgi:flagellar hook-associated protein 2
VQQQLLGLVAGAGAAGVSVTRDGMLTFDQAAFTTAFATDPSKVKAAFGAGTSFSPASGVAGTVRFSSAASSTSAGTYAVTVSALAAREQWSITAGLTAGQVVTLRLGGSTAAYTVKPGDDTAAITAGISAAAAAAGIGVAAADDGAGGISLTADAPGAARAFTADVDGAAGTRTVVGTDVAGTIDGQPATGLGTVLSLTTGTGGAQYLALDTSGLSDADLAATGGAVGSVTYQPGLAQRLASLVDTETKSGTGILTAAQQGRLTAVKTLQDQIDAWDQRLTDYRNQLTAQFTAMETALATLKSQTGALSGLSTSMLSNSSSS